MLVIIYTETNGNEQLVNPKGIQVCCEPDCTRGYFVGQSSAEFEKSVKKAVHELNKKAGGSRYRWEER